MSHPLLIRPAVPEDAPALAAVYAPYVEQTAITFEYNVPTAAEFAQRIAHTLEHYPYLVAEQSGRIVGYAYAGAFGSRAAYDWSVEMSVYLAMDCRGSGIGTQLYHALEGELKKRGFRSAEACIAYIDPEDEYLTQSSVRFHERLGYRMVGCFDRCAYKFGRWYDMVWMEKHLAPHENGPWPMKTPLGR